MSDVFTDTFQRTGSGVADFQSAGWSQVHPSDATLNPATNTATDRMSLITGGDGAKFLKFRTHHTDVSPLTPTTNPRTQLNTGDIMPDGSENFIAAALRYPGGVQPDNFIFPTDWNLQFQLFGSPYNGSPPLSLGVRTGTNRLIISHYGFDVGTSWVGPVVALDHLYKFLIRYKVAATGGYYELWLDGVQQTMVNGTFRHTFSSLQPGGTSMQMIVANYGNAGSWTGYRSMDYRAVAVKTTQAEAQAVLDATVPAGPAPAPPHIDATPSNGKVTIARGTITGARAGDTWQLYRSTNADFSSPVNVNLAIPLATTSYDDVPVLNGTTYYYRASVGNATDGYGAWDAANTPSAVPFSPPTYLLDTCTGSQGAQFNTHTVDTNHPASEHPSQTTGALIVDGGRVRSNSTSAVTYLYAINPSSLIQIMEADHVLTAAGAAHEARFALFQSPTDLSGLIMGTKWDGTSDSLVISKRNAAGTITDIGTLSLGAAAATTVKMRAIAMPGFQALFFNDMDTPALVTTDSLAGLTAGQLGMYWTGSSSHYKLDNIRGYWVSSAAATASTNAPSVAIPPSAAVGDFAIAFFSTIGSLQPPVPTSPGTGQWRPLQFMQSLTPNSSGINTHAFGKTLTGGDLGWLVTSAVGGTANNTITHIVVIPRAHATRPFTTNIWERNGTSDTALSVNADPADSAHKFSVPYGHGWEVTSFSARIAVADATLALTPPADMLTLQNTRSPDNRSVAAASVKCRLAGIPSPAALTATLSVASTQKGGVRILARPADSNAQPIIELHNRMEFVDHLVTLQPSYGTDTTRDPDGDALTWTWTQTGGTAVTLTGANTPTPSFTAPATPGTLTFQAVITDPGGKTATGTMTVAVVANPALLP